MHRLFVALRPPPPVREALMALDHGIPGARWQDAEQLHLTLRFIGAVERPVAEDIAVALAQVYAPDPSVQLAGIGRFERRGRTVSIWAAVTPHDALAHLHRKVNQACARAGVPPEGRAYLPHLTLARFSRSAGDAPEIATWLAAHAALASAPFGFGHLVLYESHLGGEGARYEPVARWPLG
jgi:2'-5' RNA ligase